MIERLERLFWRVLENEWVRWAAWVLAGYMVLVFIIACGQ